ncbi:MAG: co-chaperone GroES [Victivallaceae bacterium]
MVTDVKPLNNKILLKRSKVTVSKGGILLPDSAQEKPKEGYVIATGPGKTDEHGKLQVMTVKEGDRVLFSSYAGLEVKNDEIGDDEYLILSETDILGILV